MSNEIWKSISGYEGLYEVSNEGNIRSLKFGKVKIVKPNVKPDGYLQVDLYKEGQRKIMYVHRLVYAAFNDEIPAGLTVNHKDENKVNNNIDNLELMTIAENNNYGTRNTRIKLSTKKGTLRERNPVYCYNTCTVYSSSHEAARILNVNAGNICYVCAGKYTHTKGYKFRYATPEEIQRLVNLQRYIQTDFSYTDFEQLKKVESNEVKQVESYILF